MIETVDAIATEIIGRERAALDRWGRGDPSGFLEICAPDVVYFESGRSVAGSLGGSKATQPPSAPATQR